MMPVGVMPVPLLVMLVIPVLLAITGGVRFLPLAPLLLEVAALMGTGMLALAGRVGMMMVLLLMVLMLRLVLVGTVVALMK